MAARRDQDGLYRRKNSPYWWASLTAADGRRTRKSTQTADRKEAEALLSKWRLEAWNQRHWQAKPDRTFDELMLAYLQDTNDQHRSGPARIRSTVRRLYAAFSERSMSSITPVDVRGYIRQRRDQGAAAGTINKETGLLSAACNHANREWGWDISNPATGCRQREPEGRLRWLSKAQATALITAADQHTRAPHLSAFIRLALHTGCRKGELLQLEWSRVDLQARLIYLEAEHTKSAKRRTIPLNDTARQALLERASHRAEHCPASPWVFSHRNGDRIKDIKRSFATACKRAGIDNFRVHDLRHTCAAWLVQAGVQLAEVRDLLGHGSIQMTERYAHLAPENIRAAVSRLDSDASQTRHTPQDKSGDKSG